MWDGGLDGLYRATLAGSHRMVVKAEVWSSAALDAELLIADLPILDGSVTANLNSRVVRQLNAAVDQSYYPEFGTEPLAPYGSVVRVYRGVEYGDGTQVLFPVFAGRIQEPELDSESGRCTFTASDFAAEVIGFGFEQPENSNFTDSVPLETKRLIRNAFPDATFGSFDTFLQTVSQMTWQNNRGSALDELATSVGGYWYCLADGSFVLRRYPWTVSSAPLTTLRDGDGGVIEKYRFKRSRSQVFNSVTVSTERLNGEGPLFETVRDTTPGSITYFDGPFGRRSEQLYLHNPAGVSDVLGAARAALRRDISLVEYSTWTQSPDAAMELGDVLSIDVSGRSRPVVQVVDGFTLPLGLGTMTVSARSLIVPVLH